MDSCSIQVIKIVKHFLNVLTKWMFVNIIHQLKRANWRSQLLLNRFLCHFKQLFVPSEEQSYNACREYITSIFFCDFPSVGVCRFAFSQLSVFPVIFTWVSVKYFTFNISFPFQSNGKLPLLFPVGYHRKIFQGCWYSNICCTHPYHCNALLASLFVIEHVILILLHIFSPSVYLIQPSPALPAPYCWGQTVQYVWLWNINLSC